MREVKIPGGTLFYSNRRPNLAPRDTWHQGRRPDMIPPKDIWALNFKQSQIKVTKPSNLERRAARELDVRFEVPLFVAVEWCHRDCFGRPKWAQSCRGNLRYYATTRVAPCERYFDGPVPTPEYPSRRYWGRPYARCDNEFRPTAIDWCSWPCQE